MPRIKIVPSILSANQDRLQEEINEIVIKKIQYKSSIRYSFDG